MSAPTESTLLKALAAVPDPGGARDIVSAGRVESVSCNAEGRARLILAIDPKHARTWERAGAAAKAALAAVPGVRDAQVILTAEKASAPAPASQAPADGASGVRAIVAIASGKGGVGKSTVTANLAVSLARLGFSAGILDADIYGPSQPKLLGLTGKPETDVARKRITPMQAHGVKALSLGMMVPADQAVAWRGPMTQKAIDQMLYEGDWGDLDILLVDMPPGTGDAALGLAKTGRLTGAVVVCTPQDLALIDARRAIAMFDQLKVPVLGVIENMSNFICPHCGEATELFGHGGARSEAHRRDIPFLGEIPLALSVREASDAGAPIAATQPGSAEGVVYEDIARRLAELIEEKL
jgi:ATP-binding protein involved in chromosome partitioning